jgi:hypothetical protein
MIEEHNRAAVRPQVDERLMSVSELLPWRHARDCQHCFLYWMPVSQFPAPAMQRRWLLRFFEALAGALEKERRLNSETFVQLRTVTEDADVQREFLNHSMDLRPLLGYARSPHAEIPPATLSQEELDAFTRGERKPDLYEHMPAYCYWFVKRDGELHRRLFLGHGGMTLLFLPPDPKTRMPEELKWAIAKINRIRMLQPLREQMDIDKELKSTASLHGEFLSKSKAVFGVGMERDLHYRGLPYIIPLLSSRDFFESPAEIVESWFGVFEMYVRESPTDAAIILASKASVHDLVISVVEALRAEGLTYPSYGLPIGGGGVAHGHF